MGLDGVKNLLGSASELLTGNPIKMFLSNNSDKNKKLTGSGLNNDEAMRTVTKRFIESQNALRLAANSPEPSFAQTNFNQTFSPKAIIIPLKAGVKNAEYEELSRSAVKATLEQNGIHPSNIEMEEIMALPQNQGIDMNGWFDKKWNFHDLPGKMPAPGKYTDINGRQVFGYKMTLSPSWQAGIISDYKQVKGELSKPENVNRKAVVDMKMTERLNEMVKIAWEKGYISDEVKKQLGSLTPEELAGVFAVGGVIGIIGTTEAGGAVLGPAGIVVGGAYTAKQMMDFSRIADDCALATNRQQLDKPAKEFGAFLGNLSKDGVLALVGMAGGITAPKVMPRVEEVLTNKVGNVKQILKDGLPKLDEPILTTPEGIKIKLNQIEKPIQASEDLTLFRNRGADIGGSRAPVEGRGIPNRGNGAPEFNDASTPAKGDTSPTGGLRGHAGKHEILGEQLTAQQYYDQAIENMNYGAKFEYTHNGQIKTGYLTKVGDKRYLFTGCSRNSKRIFTHYVYNESQLRGLGITLKQK